MQRMLVFVAFPLDRSHQELPSWDENHRRAIVAGDLTTRCGFKFLRFDWNARRGLDLRYSGRWDFLGPRAFIDSGNTAGKAKLSINSIVVGRSLVVPCLQGEGINFV